MIKPAAIGPIRILLKKYFLIILLFAFQQVAAIAQDFNSRFSAASGAINAGRLDEALSKFEDLLKEQPHYSAIHNQLSWIHLLKGDFTKAHYFAEQGYNLNQADMASAITKAYVLLGNNQKEAGFGYLKQALWLDADGSNLSNVEKDLNDLIKYQVNPSLIKEALALAKAFYPNRNKAFISIYKYLKDGDQLVYSKDYPSAKRAYDKAILAFNQSPEEHRFLKVAVLNRIAEIFLTAANDYDATFAGLTLQQAKIYTGRISTAPVISAAYILSEAYWRKNEYEKGLALCKSYSPMLSSAPEYGNYRANFLMSYAKHIHLSQQANPNAWQVLVTIATQLRNVKSTSADAFYHANAENLLGNALSYSGLPVDKKKSEFHFRSALILARRNNYSDLVKEISPNLALIHWQAGEKEKALGLWSEAAEQARTEGDLSAAEACYNNAGAACYLNGDFGKAAPLFEKAVAITEQIRQTLKGREKILYFQKNISAYQFLVAAYARSGNGIKVFEFQNKDRGRVLNETLNRKAGLPVPAASFQQLLKPDEVCLFYSQLNAGTFIINVVTREGISPVFLEDHARWIAIKKKYLDRIHAADAKAVGYKPANGIIEAGGITYKVKDEAQLISHRDMDEMMQLTRECLQDVAGHIPAQITRELLSSYYQSLIAPVISKIGDSKKLIIFPDGILNFLPFEALLNNEGSALIQNYDVRYCQSADVFRSVSMRRYPETRLPFLGMGGALYEDMSEQVSPVRSPEQLLNLQELAEQNLYSNRPQREIYASLFGSKKMNYLPGTLKEIQNLSAIFPNSKVFFGTDMTENRIKDMSSSGELKNYKIIHLATHGFAVPEIPELSGVAMCIFNKMRGSEDGYLTAPEIAKLQINADLAVLSACETALGKIYGGEGVAGLTGALLTAGANQALVSLWPVSDEGTMYFMTGLYTLTTKEGKTYDEAASIMKRRFINGEFGEQFRHYNFWAPYVNYGK